MLFIIVPKFTIIGEIIKFFLTCELSSKLGREVAEHEIVSINTQIETEENADKKINRQFNEKG
jgi:hypothetical protein